MSGTSPHYRPHEGCIVRSLGATAITFEESSEGYKKGVLTNPAPPQAHRNLARAYRRSFRYLDALEELGIAIDARRDFAEAYFEMAQPKVLELQFPEMLAAPSLRAIARALVENRGRI